MDSLCALNNTVPTQFHSSDRAKLECSICHRQFSSTFSRKRHEQMHDRSSNQLQQQQGTPILEFMCNDQEQGAPPPPPPPQSNPPAFGSTNTALNTFKFQSDFETVCTLSIYRQISTGNLRTHFH